MNLIIQRPGVLAEPFRVILRNAEREARLAHASAVHDETQESEEMEIKARLEYEELCISILVCIEYECYKRTEEGALHCAVHTEEMGE